MAAVIAVVAVAASILKKLDMCLAQSFLAFTLIFKNLVTIVVPASGIFLIASKYIIASFL